MHSRKVEDKVRGKQGSYNSSGSYEQQSEYQFNDKGLKLESSVEDRREEVALQEEP